MRRILSFVADRPRMAHQLEFDEVSFSREQVHGIG